MKENNFSYLQLVRRRMDRKWQETPLQKALMVEDEFIGMKQRAMFLYIKRGIENNRLTLWEAFNIFDCIDSGTIAPEELWGALKFLNMPNVTAEDVLDIFELADFNDDGVIDYHEYIDALRDPCKVVGEEEDDSDEKTNNEKRGTRQNVRKDKIEPYGGEELKSLILKRRRQKIEEKRQRQLRRLHSAIIWTINSINKNWKAAKIIRLAQIHV